MNVPTIDHLTTLDEGEDGVLRANLTGERFVDDEPDETDGGDSAEGGEPTQEEIEATYPELRESDIPEWERRLINSQASPVAPAEPEPTEVPRPDWGKLNEKIGALFNLDKLREALSSIHAQHEARETAALAEAERSTALALAERVATAYLQSLGTEDVMPTYAAVMADMLAAADRVAAWLHDGTL